MREERRGERESRGVEKGKIGRKREGRERESDRVMVFRGGGW